MKRFSLLIALLIHLNGLGNACEVIALDEIHDLVRNGNSEESYCAIKSLYLHKFNSHRVIFEMLDDDTLFYWFCGHSATHFRNDSIKLEPDVDLSSKSTKCDSLDVQSVDLTVAQVAAYVLISIELNDLNFAEYCNIHTSSKHAVVLNEIRELVGDAGGSPLGCELFEILANHDVLFRRCDSEGGGYIEAAKLKSTCSQ